MSCAREVPALLTRMSSRPKVPAIRSNSFPTSPDSETSACMATAVPPSFSMAADGFGRRVGAAPEVDDDGRSLLRQHHGHARPSPRDAPVTSAIFPSSSFMILILPDSAGGPQDFSQCETPFFRLGYYRRAKEKLHGKSAGADNFFSFCLLHRPEFPGKNVDGIEKNRFVCYVI